MHLVMVVTAGRAARAMRALVEAELIFLRQSDTSNFGLGGPHVCESLFNLLNPALYVANLQLQLYC
jgi:hypothetical protein